MHKSDMGLKSLLLINKSKRAPSVSINKNSK